MFPRFYGGIIFIGKLCNGEIVKLVDCHKRNILKTALYIFFSILYLSNLQSVSAQVLGGSSTFNFLKLPVTPQLSALGGINISNRTNDIGLIMSNPSFLREDMSGQLHASFNSMYAGIKNLALVGGYHLNDWKTNVGVGISYLDYGNIDATDPSGNILGNIHPKDLLVHAMISRQYESRWHYGFAVSFIQSSYGQYQSNAIAVDASGSYYDSVHLFQASLVLKNMGTQLKSFVPGTVEQLPFDMQLGVSKRLAKAPIQFSVTAHHLHQFDLIYNDTSATGGQEGSSSFTNKLFQHFVFGAQFYIEEKIEVTAGYNILRRSELRIENTTNGFTGFSFGAGYTGGKLQIRYARSWYQNNTAYNQFGLNFFLF